MSLISQVLSRVVIKLDRQIDNNKISLWFPHTAVINIKNTTVKNKRHAYSSISVFENSNKIYLCFLISTAALVLE